MNALDMREATEWCAGRRGRDKEKPWRLFWHLTSKFTEEKTKLTFSGGLQGQRLTAAITATPVGFQSWLMLLRGTQQKPPCPPQHHPLRRNEELAVSEEQYFKVYFSPRGILWWLKKRRNLYSHLLHSNNCIHRYQLDTLWGHRPSNCTVSGAIFIFFLNTQRA